jgi:hypothetical protein
MNAVMRHTRQRDAIGDVEVTDYRVRGYVGNELGRSAAVLQAQTATLPELRFRTARSNGLGESEILQRIPIVLVLWSLFHRGMGA